MDFYKMDCKTLLSEIKREEKRLRTKRRWLMELTMTKSEEEQLKELGYPRSRNIAESLLREDEVSYEMTKATCQKGFEACFFNKDFEFVQDNIQLVGLINNSIYLSSLLENMTYKGLCQFAEIVEGNLVKLEKTHAKMKKTIQLNLPKVIGNLNNNSQTNILKQLALVLMEPHNFRWNCFKLSLPTSESFRAAAIKVLDGLEDLPFRTLTVMHRKLRGIHGYIPKINPSKSGWGHSVLINQVRKRCMKMLPKQVGDRMPEPLANALAVAGLTIKLIMNCPFNVKFQNFSPDTVALQNDIVKAIWLLDKKVRFPGLKDLQHFLDPNTELSSRCLRAAVRNWLTECLLECGHMDTIPESLFKTLAIINGSSHSPSYIPFSKEAAEEELECVLSVSAQIKQIVLDLLPDYEFDLYFADAYMDDLEEVGDGDVDQRVVVLPDIRFHSTDSYHLTGSVLETKILSPAHIDEQDCASPSTHPGEIASVASCCSASSFSERKFAKILQKEKQHQFGSSGNLMPKKFYSDSLLGDQACSSAHFELDRNPDHHDVGEVACVVDIAKKCEIDFQHCSSGNASLNKKDTQTNPYLAVQEASDETSRIAHSLVGCMLEEFAQRDGLELDWRDISYLKGGLSVKNFQATVKREQHTRSEDAFIQVLEDLIPSFPSSGKEELKCLMDLK